MAQLKSNVRHLDLFSGIGGFAYAARTVWRDGYENVGFCEIDPFCQAVLRKNFEGCTIFGDIRTLANTCYAGLEGGKQVESAGYDGQPDRERGDQASFGTVDLITGGFPCQPFSVAGRRRGTDDDRYLWPEMFAVIRRFKPSWVIAENVGGLVTWNEGMVLEQVCTDLESEEYEVQPFIIPAVAVNAPHRRDRVWIVAHAINHRPTGEKRSGPGAPDSIPQEYRTQNNTTGQLVGADSDRQTDQLTADSDSDRLQEPGTEQQTSWCRQSFEANADPTSTRLQSSPQQPVRPSGQCSDEGWPDWSRDWREVALATCHDGVDDGLSKTVVRLPDGSEISHARWRKEALKAYGNAIVPQVAMEIMKAIKEV